jgi:hypothetical protein
MKEQCLFVRFCEKFGKMAKQTYKKKECLVGDEAANHSKNFSCFSMKDFE